MLLLGAPWPPMTFDNDHAAEKADKGETYRHPHHQISVAFMLLVFVWHMRYWLLRLLTTNIVLQLSHTPPHTWKVVTICDFRRTIKLKDPFGAIFTIIAQIYKKSILAHSTQN